MDPTVRFLIVAHTELLRKDAEADGLSGPSSGVRSLLLAQCCQE